MEKETQHLSFRKKSPLFRSMSTITKEQVLKALEQVDDPTTGKNIVESNRVTNVHIAENKIAINLDLPEGAFSYKDTIKKSCESNIKIFLGQDIQVLINMNIESKGIQASSQELNTSGIRNIIAVASGKGGVGKSTVSANFAISLAQQGYKVGLLDADIYGPSAPILFGIRGERPMMRNVEGKGMIEPIQKFGVKIISMGMLVDEKQAVIWRGPMATSAIRQFIKDVYWGELDFLILDMPPGTGDIHLTVTSALQISGAIIVTTPQTVALADAKKGLMMFRQNTINTPILGIVENMSYFTPAELPENKYYIFGKNGGKELAEQFNVPFLGEIPLVQSIREGGDKGFPAVINDDEVSKNAFMQISKNAIDQLFKVN